MDVSTAKTLVSAVLVCAIVLFSGISLRMFVLEVGRDLRSARAQRVTAGNDRRD
ncbi:hypothetical protein MKK70_03835 [Methylobacterium sp. E-041]|uniref:hypothetical protein n=1 Tax=unclassified Methylobacterium TaxID=2615210 RepID=UPI0016503E4E|nr:MULTISPECIES: hypothetical protein [unclassified Methylobacterium]MCJ2007126.1 hypothetical protein [Methylobacterium sp. J-092]MCJ2042405.1 hypothetical protein [Methylobacterium sp. J-059]MCJ2076600.1 hypothetical protein [Methylobacterium sp. E-016]MCJ2104522.1 hypothetical protein [Methylobacterium sp. E-041]MCJ2114559.1 hypothetical protein [Methylobacterium sp. E-025]